MYYLYPHHWPNSTEDAYDGTCVYIRKPRKLKDLVLEKNTQEMHLEIVFESA